MCFPIGLCIVNLELEFIDLLHADIIYVCMCVFIHIYICASITNLTGMDMTSVIILLRMTENMGHIKGDFFLEHASLQ